MPELCLLGNNLTRGWSKHGYEKRPIAALNKSVITKIFWLKQYQMWPSKGEGKLKRNKLHAAWSCPTPGTRSSDQRAPGAPFSTVALASCLLSATPIQNAMSNALELISEQKTHVAGKPVPSPCKPPRPSFPKKTQNYSPVDGAVQSDHPC